MNTNKMPVIELHGSARNRGRIHGEALRDRIRPALGAWKEILCHNYGVEPDRFIREFIDNTDLVAATRRWMPTMVDEIEGIAEASGASFEDLWALNCGDETYWFGRNAKYGYSGESSKSCSAIGVAGRPGTIVAQNMDLSAWAEGYQALYRVRHEGRDLESYVFGYAGKIGLTGVNSAGVAICANSILQLNQNANGLPVTFVVRGVLEQSTLDAAIGFLNEISHASGQNYVMGGPGQVCSLECSDNKVVGYEPYVDGTRVWHTNHPVVNDDQSIFEHVVKLMPESERPSAPNSLQNSSETRLQSLQQRIGEPSDDIDVETVRATLSSKDDQHGSICRHMDTQGRLFNYTAGCLIYELSTNPVLHVASGPPDITEFRTLRF